MGILHGFIFSATVLIAKKYKSRANTYLAFTILSLAISTLQYWFLDMELWGREVFRLSTELLILPMFYLYVEAYLGRSLKNRLKVILVLPFIFSLVISILFYYKAFSDNETTFVINVIHEVISVLYSSVLIVLIFYQIFRHEKKAKEFDRNKVFIATRWLKQILVIGFLICLLWMIVIFYMQKGGHKGYHLYYPLWISHAFLIYWIAYVGVFQANIFKERKHIRNNELKKKRTADTSKLSPDLFTKIEQFISNDEVYLDPELSLDHIAEKFDKSSGYVSQIINKNLGQSFTDYINSLRVEKAKKLLAIPEYNRYTITAIAMESGFNSKSSFYYAFKKHLGVTPNLYKKSVQNF